VSDTPRPHWLVRPATIRLLWRASAAILVLLVLLDLIVVPHGKFGADGTFGFYAWYGFVTCAAMVLGAKALGALIKREDTYYDR
jgi:hypothetical protein